MADMKKRRFLTPAESNELSRQVTQTRLKHTGVLAAAQKRTSDPNINRLFDAIKEASAPRATKASKATKPKSAKLFANEKTLKRLAGFSDEA